MMMYTGQFATATTPYTNVPHASEFYVINYPCPSVILPFIQIASILTNWGFGFDSNILHIVGSRGPTTNGISFSDNTGAWVTPLTTDFRTEDIISQYNLVNPPSLGFPWEAWTSGELAPSEIFRWQQRACINDVFDARYPP